MGDDGNCTVEVCSRGKKRSIWPGVFMFGGLDCFGFSMTFGRHTKINLHSVQRFSSYPVEQKLCLL